jgi:glycine hydroxymethyltransferase
VNPSDTFSKTLAEIDPEIQDVLDKELGRQRGTLEMIASENFVPHAVLEAQGSVLTNKYAEGYPGKRYYGGCEFVDIAENLAIERAKKLFGAAYANVQPHSGASASAAVLHALAQPGDTILGLELAHGGHLTHGMKLNFSGKVYNATSYGVDPNTFLIDMDKVRDAALEHKPRVLIAGWSAYPRHLDFEAFRSIADEVGASLWVDMAHFAGLVAAGVHPSPIPYADVVSTTVHKTLGGPRSGIILSRDESLGKKLNSAVFPGQQGGPLMHVIAAKAVAFKLAMDPSFRDRQERTIRGAQLLTERLTAADSKSAGVDVLTGGTDVHLALVDLRHSPSRWPTGRGPSAPRGHYGEPQRCALSTLSPPMVTSGVRIGTRQHWPPEDLVRLSLLRWQTSLPTL